jgi:hypothetical protein
MGVKVLKCRVERSEGLMPQDFKGGPRRPEASTLRFFKAFGCYRWPLSVGGRREAAVGVR